ncbi:hypothetical protein [Pandoraea sputorum]|uniref:hypothetical protein n=1 Tax=Pandoraea sputorum TaxID=93222 RepID=UPI002F407DB5
MSTPDSRSVRERPVLFSAPMVRAILDGSKTQTRRVMKTQLVYGDVCGIFPSWYLPTGPDSGTLWPNGKEQILAMCPYGQPGQRLWVRETWSSDFANHYPCNRVRYAADVDRRLDIEVRDGVRGIFSPESNVFVPFRWRPSIHMPRWASRLTLEITGVRVERLNSISEADAHAEGSEAIGIDQRPRLVGRKPVGVGDQVPARRRR